MSDIVFVLARVRVGRQDCSLADLGCLWRLTFAIGRLENLRFLIQIICWAPLILQFQSTGLPSIVLRAQHWEGLDGIPLPKLDTMETKRRSVGFL